jgi:hypothetical protein
MMESKEVHKGIYQIEWEHKKMEMEMEDLNQRAWDIEMLFFSRDRQKASLPCPSLCSFFPTTYCLPDGKHMPRQM